jgi:hypothetical protein
MRDQKTEQFLDQGGYRYEYHPHVDFSEIDLKASYENPARLLRRVDEDRAISYALAMEEGTEFPAIVLLTYDGGTPPAHYLIATGVHRTEAALLAKRTDFDAYVVTEADVYRRESLIRRLNTIEGQGVSIRDRILQVLQLHETYQDRSLRQLAKDWNLKDGQVKAAWAEQQAMIRGRRFGFDFAKVKLSRSSIVALHGIQNDVVFGKAAQFAVLTGASTAEVDELCKEVKKTRDETSGLAAVERATQDAAARKMQVQAKHGRISPAPATKFFATIRTLNNLADKGIEQLYLSAYSRQDLGRLLCESTIDLLKRIIAELDRIKRLETPPPPTLRRGVGGVELHA